MKKFLFFSLFAVLLALAGVANAQRETVISVGTATDSTCILPSNSAWNYSYTQLIYPRTALPDDDDVKINEISFYFTGRGVDTVARSHNWVVYMKMVSTAEFATDSSYISVTKNDRVFRGKFNIPATSGWVTIKLDNEFYYTNTYTQNLLIAIYDSTSPFRSRYFRRTSTSGKYCLQYKSDTYTPNPEKSLNPYYGNKSRYNYLPVMKLGFSYDTAATLPYTANFSDARDNCQWNISNWPGKNVAGWKFNTSSSDPYMYCGVNAAGNYNTASPVTSVIERRIKLGNSDSIKVSFNCTVGGEVEHFPSIDNYWDYMSVFLVPASINYSMNPAENNATSYLGSSADSMPRYGLYFGEYGRLASVKLSGLNNQNLSATIANMYPGEECRLVFVWTNDNEDGDGVCVKSIKNLSVTEVNRQPDYTPRSSLRWYGYAYWVKGENKNLWQEHFLTFDMRNLANVDTASEHFSTDISAGTYAKNYVWYTKKDDYGHMIRANINQNNRFVSGEINYPWSVELDDDVMGMQYNHADSNMYLITKDRKLYKVDMSDPEHYTLMGQMSIDIAAFAINAQGDAYVVEDQSSGNFYRLNLNNGSTTLIGSMGIKTQYYMSMAFDYNTGELFLASYDGNVNADNFFNTAMFYVNPANAEAKYIGKLGGGGVVEMIALFAVQTPGQQGIATASAAEFGVFPNPAKDELRVNGVENGTKVMVYDMTGKLVAQQTATENTVINVSSLNKGVYVLSAGERKIKFVKE